MSGTTIEMLVWRQQSVDSEGRWDSFDVDAADSPSVLDALRAINESPVLRGGGKAEPIALDGEGDFGVNVNGSPVRAAEARIDGSEEVVVVEPLSVFPVLKDLRVDRSGFERDLAEATGLAPEGFDAEGLVSDCVRCGLCMEACNDTTAGGEYVGPVVVHVLERSNRAAGGAEAQARRMDILMGDRGVVHDRSTYSYETVCPDGVELVQSVGLAKRSSALQWIREFFQN